MTDLIELCKTYFNTSNFYEVLNISKDATQSEVKKAYHKLSLSVHPDRVEESKKAEATEKFKVLSKVHSILSDKEKRNVYDDTGSFDEMADTDWWEYWRCIFRPITKKDITDYEKKYKGSEEERIDLKKAYENGKGDMDFILETVPFTNTDEEPRIREIIDKLIESGEVKSYRAYTHESEKKREKRKRKYAKEAEEAERLMKSSELEQEEEEEEDDLFKAIQRRSQERAQNLGSFFSQLEAKYCGGKEQKSRKSAKKVGSPAGEKKETRTRNKRK